MMTRTVQFTCSTRVGAHGSGFLRVHAPVVHAGTRKLQPCCGKKPLALMSAYLKFEHPIYDNKYYFLVVTETGPEKSLLMKTNKSKARTPLSGFRTNIKCFNYKACMQYAG